MIHTAAALEKIDNRIKIQERHLSTIEGLASSGNPFARGTLPYLADEIRWLYWLRRDLDDED
jgi:hypothetical protein